MANTDKPRGNTGQPGKVIKILIRLPSLSIHQQLHDASRGHGRSINEFVVNAILEKINDTPTAPRRTSAQRVVEQVEQSKSDDAFDLVTVEQLSAIARAASVTDSQAYQVIKQLMQQLSRR